MIPLNAKAADREYVIGATYRLEHREERSSATHAHEFAWLAEAWRNLPEHLAEIYASPEHLRKRALIEAGWYTEQIIDCGSNAAALRVGSYLRGNDGFALIVIRGPLVAVRTARSQSHRAMNRQEFQASKTAIMDVVARLIGVSPDALLRNTAA